MTALNGWENFYVIVGSAAGALIGLQFVVVTLIADKPALRTVEAGAAFATPTIVHFGVVLLLSALVSVPWHGIGTVSIVWGLVGLIGIVYAVVVALSHTREALFGVAAATLLLLFIGIHNAWDGVVYHVFVNNRNAGTERRRDETSERETL
jgi:hypothetical protein